MQSAGVSGVNFQQRPQPQKRINGATKRSLGGIARSFLALGFAKAVR